MPKIVQTITVKVEKDHERALEAVKNLKKALDGHAVVRAHLAIEAGPASGYATITIEFPSAAAWAALVDSDKDSLLELRGKAVQSESIVSTSLLQEVEL